MKKNKFYLFLGVVFVLLVLLVVVFCGDKYFKEIEVDGVKIILIFVYIIFCKGFKLREGLIVENVFKVIFIIDEGFVYDELFN